MQDNVAMRGKFDYSYLDYIAAWLLSICCCRCFNKISFCEEAKKRYANYTKATETFEEELNIERVMEALRLTKLMAKASLKTYQRQAVDHFRRYQVEEINPTYDDKNNVKVHDLTSS